MFEFRQRAVSASVHWPIAGEGTMTLTNKIWLKQEYAIRVSRVFAELHRYD